MQRLLATVAAAGATASACAQEPNPVSAPIDTGGGPNVASSRDADTSRDAEAAPDATDTVEATDPEPDAAPATTMTGYAVVDPVPPPSVCPQAAAQIRATAVWKTQPSGLVVVVNLAKGRGPDKISYVPQFTPSGYGASIVASSGPGDTKRIVLSPNPNQTAVSLGVPAMCNGRPINISVGLDLHKTPKAGDAVPLTLSSY